MKHYFQTLFVLFFSFSWLSVAGEPVCKYRIYLKDKDTLSHSISSPNRFLGSMAIRRRNRQGIEVDVKDFPLNTSYVSTLKQYASAVEFPSKWLNTIVVSLEDEQNIEMIKRLDFVKSVKKVWVKEAIHRVDSVPRRFNPILADEIPDSLLQENPYGDAFEQIHIHGGERLHTMGYRGDGVSIAVLENGFRNVDALFPFSKTKIQGQRNFLSPDTNVYVSDFVGTRILSVMGANEKGNYVGTAPDADYVLVEVNTTYKGFPIEEDRWVSALEYADSIGSDIIVSSLGFSRFDKRFEEYKTGDLNGHTAFSSQAVNVGREKGLLFVLSSGDERNMKWEGVHFPADCDNILVVGATKENGERGDFSAAMHTSSGRIKPDVVSLGHGVSVVDYTGKIVNATGNAYAMAIVAGLSACIKQAFPTLSSEQLVEAIKKGGLNKPTLGVGHNRPDFFKAYLNAKRMAED